MLHSSVILFDLPKINSEIAELEAKQNQDGFWDDQNNAKTICRRLSSLQNKIENYEKSKSAYKDIVEMLSETKESDADMLDLIGEAEDELASSCESIRHQLLFSGKYDSLNCTIEIHPGAGGTEAQDWANMLLRMYQRYAASHDLKFEIEDYEPGEEAGVKSVSIRIQGKNAFGLLKSENGVHRLVRISPFDSAKRRHTSFASVEVIPEIDQSIEVDINPDDLRIDVYRSSGAGGQHINKTSSAVRITHLPTGIVTSSQAQRSQLQNRETAMNMLRAKLFQLEEEKKRKQTEELKGNQKEIGFGSQIRSYVFHPYNMVKDHRTNFESSDVNGVMDGKLDNFIYAYLQWLLSQKNPN